MSSAPDPLSPTGSAGPAGPDGPRPGLVLGPWTLSARLGAGGTATVWRAQDAAGSVVAVKVVAEHDVRPEDLVRLERERDALAGLDHPHVVQVRGSGRDRGLAWIALEYVDGQDLDAQLRQWRERPDPDRFEEADRIFRELADALQHIHEHGLVHRDVKPANVLLDADGRVKLTDFGVVNAPDVSRITMAGSLVGTIAYMAPELIAEEPFDRRADLYGLGAVLYAMLTLRRPIEADTVAGYLSRHLTAVPVPPHELDADVPRGLERVALRLLEKIPDRRYGSARAAVQALERGDEEGVVVVGRDAETALWRQRLDAWRHGLGGLVIVEGPPGSGRSTVLASFAELARDAGLVVVDADADPLPDDSVLVVDDVESLDPDRRHRVDAALAAHHLVLVARRVGGLRHAAGDDEVIALSPLDRRAVTQLLRGRGVPSGPAAALGARLADTTTAHPAAVLALLDALERHGWLARQDGRLVATRPVAAFRQDTLPVPDRVARDLRRRLGRLDDVARELVELLTLLGRPAGASLLARAASRAALVPAALDRLVDAGLVRLEVTDEDATLELAVPGLPAVVLQDLDPEAKVARHLALAQVLGRRRRRSSSEAAVHLAAGGRPDEALPVFLDTARRALADGRAADALADTTAAAPLAAADPAQTAPWSELHGGALLALGRWTDALPVLEQALDLAPPATEAHARAAARLGRTLYRLGRLDEAAPVLAAALAEGAGPDVSSARRALADVHLQHGDLDDAMRLLREALDEATDPDDEARARRGIAHALGLLGRFGDAARELAIADDLLVTTGDARVRAGVLTRRVELDLAAGHLAMALQRVDTLVDLLGAHHLGARLPDALGLAAAVRVALGRGAEAVPLAQRALVLARPAPHRTWEGVLHAVRSLCAVDRLEGSEVRLVDAITDVTGSVRQPAAKAHALLACLLAQVAPDEARTHARIAAEAPPADWRLSQVHRLLDLGRAHVRLDQPDAATASLDSALALLDDDALGARLELALVRPHPDRATLSALVDAIASPLPGRLRTEFLARVARRAPGDASPY